MTESKLGLLLSSFDTADWKRFEAFLQSSYYNTNADILALFQAIHNAGGGLGRQDKAAVFTRAFPERPYDSRRMGYLMNQLLSLAEDFLSTEKFRADDFQRHRYALTALSERKLGKHYDFRLKKARKQLGKTLENTEHLHRQYLLAEVEMIHFANQKVRRSDPSVQQAYEKLNTFYYATVLKYACTLLSWSLVVKGKFELSPISRRVIEALREAPQASPLIQIYLSIYQTMNSGNQEEDSHRYFQRLEGYIKQYQHEIDQKEMREIYLYAVNFCARRIRKGEAAYRKRVIELYEDGIAQGHLFEQGYLSHWTYTNVVKLMLLEKQFLKAEEFIHRYKEKMPPRFYNDAFHFNLAELYFQQGRYGEVLKLLQQLTFTDSHYNMGSRMLIIKTFYELNDIEPLLSNLASFTRLLMRNKNLSGAYQETMLNFCKLLHQVLRVHNDKKKRDKTALRISSTDMVAERSWLLEALNKQMASASRPK